MRKIAQVLTCLACAGNGWRVHSSFYAPIAAKRHHSLKAVNATARPDPFQPFAEKSGQEIYRPFGTRSAFISRGLRALLRIGRPGSYSSMAKVRGRIAMDAATSPPVAKRIPHKVAFGKVDGENRGPNPMEPAIELVDDYFWLRDDSRKNEEILGLLREENAFTEGRTQHLKAFRDALYDELLSHVQEDDDTYPSPAKDGYEYWTRTIKGAPFRQHLRRQRGSSADGDVILDVNKVSTLPFFAQTPGWNASQCDVRGVEPNPSGDLLAYAVDGSGYETYSIRLRDPNEGTELDEQITETSGSVSWVTDSTLFYVKFDDSHRPYQVWRHELGTAQSADVLVFEDLDDLFNVDCWVSRDGSLLFIESESKETTEIHFIPTNSPNASPILIRARQFGVRYDVDSHAPSESIFLTSNVDGKTNRELFVASLDSPSNWRPVATASASVLAHSANRSLESVNVFSSFVVVSGREEGFTQLWIVPLAANGVEAASDARRMAFEADAFAASVASNKLFECDGKLRVEYSSMIAPPALLEYDITTSTYNTLKVKPIPNYTASLYETSRIDVTARDGTIIPVTLLWRPDAVGDQIAKGGGGAPCHLYGYGSYGISMDPSFRATILPLVDRGIVYAIAHVRGGGEMGHHAWYEAQGKYLKKRNTFNDFVDCAQTLLERGIAKPGALSCEGRSAGGLLMGNVVNMAPETFVAAVAGVPFVDLMVTMCDPSIPLTTEEWEEWGNPNEEKYHAYMMSYSPINNVREGVNYPSMLIVSGLNDPRVAYWEPAKWAQVLRSKIANGNDVLLKMDLSAGHFSASDRYRYLRELAFDYAWLLDKLGKADVEEPTSST